MFEMAFWSASATVSLCLDFFLEAGAKGDGASGCDPGRPAKWQVRDQFQTNEVALPRAWLYVGLTRQIHN